MHGLCSDLATRKYVTSWKLKQQFHIFCILKNEFLEFKIKQQTKAFIAIAS